VALLAADRPEPVVLPLPDAVDEVDGWLRHRREGAWALRANRAGLVEELARSAAGVGPGATAALGGSLAGFVGAFREVAIVARPSPTQRHAALAAGGLLRASIATPGVLCAVWADLVGAVQTGGPHDAAMAQVHLLVGALRLSGHDVEALLKRLGRVLVNEAVAVAETQASLGLAASPADWSLLFGRSAAASVTERLEWCESSIARPPAVGRCIAWMAFRDAEVTTVLASGPCHFFNAEWAMGNASSADGQDFVGRRELQDDMFGPPDPGPGEQVVLARVDLGWRAPAGAMRAAADLVGGLTDIACLRSGGARWLPYGWEMLLLDGRRVTSRVFATDEVVAGWPRPYVRDRTSAELAAIGGRLGAVLAASPMTPDLSEAVRSATEAESADLRSKIVLYDRVTELVAANAGAEDAVELRRLITATWPVASWRADIFQAMNCALDAGRRASGQRHAAELAKEIRKPTPNGGWTLDLVKTADRVGELVELLDGTDGLGAAEILDTLRDPPAYVAYVERRRQECALLCDRLRRVRNALVHGNPIQVRTVRTVAAIAEHIASAALSEALAALMDGHDLFARLAEYENQQVTDLATVAEGAGPVSLLKEHGPA